MVDFPWMSPSNQDQSIPESPIICFVFLEWSQIDPLFSFNEYWIFRQLLNTHPLNVYFLDRLFGNIGVWMREILINEVGLFGFQIIHHIIDIFGFYLGMRPLSILMGSPSWIISELLLCYFSVRGIYFGIETVYGFREYLSFVVFLAAKPIEHIQNQIPL